MKNWTPCKSSKWESKLFLWGDDAAIFLIVIREDLKIHLCFCWNWKSLKVLAVLTHLAVSILGQHLFQVWIWDNDETLPDAVSASSVVGYSFHKCLFEPILWTFFQDFVLQSRNLLIVIPASAYLFPLFDYLEVISGPQLRGQIDRNQSLVPPKW